MAALNDTFTDTAGTLLENHTSNTGETWAKNTAVATGSAVVSPSGYVRGNSANDVIYYSSWTPASADYTVGVDITALTIPVTNISTAIGGRMGTAAFTGYVVGLDGNDQKLRLYRAGNSTPLGVATVSLNIGQANRLELWMVGPRVRVLWNGCVVIDVTTAGANHISVVGRAAIYPKGAFSDSTGYRFGNFVADAVDPTVTHKTVDGSVANWHENGYLDANTPPRSPSSRLIFTTDATALRITQTASILATYPSAAQVGVRVNGAPITTTASTQAKPFAVSYTLDAGSKQVEIVTGSQARPSGIVGCYADLVEVNNGASVTIVAPSVSPRRAVLYGDSIISGFNATLPETQGVGVLLRNTYGRAIMMESHGSRCLYDDCVDATARAAFVARLASYAPAFLYIEAGGADYRLAVWTAANYGTAYAALLDDLHTALPACRIYCQTPIPQSSEIANAVGSTLPEYRTQIAAAVSTRTDYAQLVDGTALLSLADTDDGVHPSTAGHAKYALALNGIVDPLTAGAASNGTPTTSSVEIEWTAGSGGNGTISPQLQKSTNGTDYSDVEGAITSPATVTGLTPATLYYFRVKYVDQTPTEVTSNVVEVTTAAVRKAASGIGLGLRLGL